MPARKGSSKAAAKVTAKGRRSRKAGRTYARYIQRINKDVGDGHSMSSQARQFIDELICSVEERVVRRAVELTRRGEKRTLGARQLRAALRLEFPKLLAEQAHQEAMQACQEFKDSV